MVKDNIAALFESYSLLISDGINLGLIQKQQVEKIEHNNKDKGIALEQLIHNVGDVLTVLKEEVLCIKVPKDPKVLKEWVAHSKEGSKVKCYDALIDVFISSQKYL